MAYKAFSCKGCFYEKDMSSHIQCHGCARMYADKFKKVCKHMREDGVCLKGASSSGRCQEHCSHYET